MDTRRLIALLFLALGVVTLLGRMSGGTGWLWMALVATAFGIAWRREKTFGLLVIGALLGGSALGMFLEGNLGWDGAFLVGLGAGLVTIDALQPPPGRWPRLAGAVAIVAGLVLGIVEAGVRGSTWYTVLLVGAGIWLVARDRTGDWVHVESAEDVVASEAERER